MIRINEVALNLDYDETSLKKAAAKKLNIAIGDIKYISLYKRSVDARKKENVHYLASVNVTVDDSKVNIQQLINTRFPYLKNSKVERKNSLHQKNQAP